MDGSRGGRSLRRITRAFFNGMERRIRCRDRVDHLVQEWRAGIPEQLDDDLRSEIEHRIRRQATRQAMGEFKLRSLKKPRVQIKAPAGLGKSTAIRDEYLGRRDLWQSHVH